MPSVFFLALFLPQLKLVLFFRLAPLTGTGFAVQLAQLLLKLQRLLCLRAIPVFCTCLLISRCIRLGLIRSVVLTTSITLPPTKEAGYWRLALRPDYRPELCFYLRVFIVLRWWKESTLNPGGMRRRDNGADG